LYLYTIRYTMNRTRGFMYASGFVPFSGGEGGESIRQSYQLNDLTDTTILNPSDEEFLRYNSSTSKWENAGFTGVQALDDLTDLNVSRADPLDILQYRDDEWVNVSIPFAVRSITNDFSSIAIGQNAKAGDDSVSIGLNACQYLNNGETNTCVGVSSGRNIFNGSGNSLFGENTCVALTNGINNAVLGSNCNVKDTATSHACIMGNSSTADSYGLAFGFVADAVGESVAMGREATCFSLSGLCIGSGTKSGVEGVSVGKGAGASLVQGGGETNCLVGFEAGTSLTGDNNTVLNSRAPTLIGGDGNVIIGVGSDTTIAEAQNAVCIGSSSKVGTNSVVIGKTSGSATLFTAVSIGANTLNSLTGNCFSTVALGDNSGTTLTSGSSNTFCGANADVQNLSGTTTQANNATAVGAGAKAGNLSTAIGSGAIAPFTRSVAIGADCVAVTEDSVSMRGQHVVRSGVGDMKKDGHWQTTRGGISIAISPAEDIFGAQCDRVATNCNVSSIVELNAVGSLADGSQGMVATMKAVLYYKSGTLNTTTSGHTVLESYQSAGFGTGWTISETETADTSVQFLFALDRAGGTDSTFNGTCFMDLKVHSNVNTADWVAEIVGT